MRTFTNLSDARIGQMGRIEDQATTLQTVTGRNLFNNLGRIFFTVTFPVVFSGRPIHCAGAELDPQTPFVALGAPIPCEATSMVVAWDHYGDVTGAWEGYFTGATIQAVIRGSKEQWTWIDWTFIGPALRNPVKSEEVIAP